MVCWRYRTIVFEFKKDGLLGNRFIDDEEVENTLNEQGCAGWELVSATMVQDGLLTLLKQPEAKPENIQNDTCHSGGETLATPADNVNFVTGVIRKEDSSPVFQGERSRASEEISNRLIGEIKIN